MKTAKYIFFKKLQLHDILCRMFVTLVMNDHLRFSICLFQENC